MKLVCIFFPSQICLFYLSYWYFDYSIESVCTCDKNRIDVVQITDLRTHHAHLLVVFSKCMWVLKFFLQHTHTHPFTTLWTLSGITQVSRHQKGKTNLDLVEQETMSGIGISWAICKSAPRPKQICEHPTTHFFTGQMPFLPPNQQCQSTEGISFLQQIPPILNSGCQVTIVVSYNGCQMVEPVALVVVVVVVVNVLGDH